MHGLGRVADSGRGCCIAQLVEEFGEEVDVTGTEDPCGTGNFEVWLVVVVVVVVGRTPLHPYPLPHPPQGGFHE